jgi:hypothetical protein
MASPTDTSRGRRIPFSSIGRPDPEDREVLHRKNPEVAHADLIDLLLDADEPTRRLIIFQALQTGVLKRSEAESLIAQVGRLERIAGPRPETAAAQAA